MDIFDAHGIFAAREHGRTCLLALVDGGAAGPVDCWPSFQVAMVSLAGFLEDAETEADLDAGLAHFKAIAEQLPKSALCDEATRILEQVIKQCHDLECSYQWN